MRRWPEMFLIFLPSSLWVVIEHSCWIPFGWNRKRRQLILQDTVPDVHHNSKGHPENQATTSAQPQSQSATSVGAGPPCSPTPQACFCWAIGLANTDMIQVLLPALALSNFHKMASPHNKRRGKKKKKKSQIQDLFTFPYLMKRIRHLLILLTHTTEKRSRLLRRSSNSKQDF